MFNFHKLLLCSSRDLLLPKKTIKRFPTIFVGLCADNFYIYQSIALIGKLTIKPTHKVGQMQEVHKILDAVLGAYWLDQHATVD